MHDTKFYFVGFCLHSFDWNIPWELAAKGFLYAKSSRITQIMILLLFFFFGWKGGNECIAPLYNIYCYFSDLMQSEEIKFYTMSVLRPEQSSMLMEDIVFLYR